MTVDLVTGATSNARLDSASVSNEWVQEIAVREGITNSKGYAIFINRFGRLESLYVPATSRTFTTPCCPRAPQYNFSGLCVPHLPRDAAFIPDFLHCSFRHTFRFTIAGHPIPAFLPLPRGAQTLPAVS